MAVRVASTRRAPGSERWLPHAVIATCFVVVLPAVLVSLLVPATSVPLLVLSLLMSIALSLLAASVGDAIWKRLQSSQDLVFADLMLWGWLRRSVAERRLGQAEKLLGSDPNGASLDALIDLSELLEARDARTYGHSQRVTRHAERIATTMGLPAAEVAKVRTAAALHDVGKLHTPRSILNKPGRLTDSEFALIKRHPVDGAVMAGGIGDPEISAMIRHHHERLDGLGYPDGLSGEDIPVGARIIAVADTFDAITSNRTYRRAAHHKRALDVLAAEAGKQLDGDAVAAFRGYYRGQRTVALSAFIASAPQRFLSWLGGVSPAIGGGRGERDLAADRRRQPAAGRLLPHQPRLPARDRRCLRAEASEHRRGLGDARAHRHDRRAAPGGAARAWRRAPRRRTHARARPSSPRPAAARPRPGRPRAAVAPARRTRPHGSHARQRRAEAARRQGPAGQDPAVHVPPVEVPSVNVPGGQGPGDQGARRQPARGQDAADEHPGDQDAADQRARRRPTRPSVAPCSGSASTRSTGPTRTPPAALRERRDGREAELVARAGDVGARCADVAGLAARSGGRRAGGRRSRPAPPARALTLTGEPPPTL